MDFGGDDRGVAVQIGAVLLLGFLVVSLSMYQATVVPRENERVESRHHQRAVSDMQEVRNGILRTASTGESAPVSVELGTRYPARAVFVNPSPPGGTLSASSLGEVSVRNVAVDDATTAADDYRDIRDFWDDAPRGYPTKALTYRPSYNRYPNAPATVYENGVLYNRFDRGDGTATVAVTGQTLVSGTRLSLVTLTGNLSHGGSETLSVDPRAVSRATRTVSVTGNATGPVSVVVPTRLSGDDWEELLRESGQLTGDGGHVVDVVGHEDAGTVEILLEPDVTYQLGMSRVRVGTGSDETEAAYLTSVDGVDAGLRAGETAEFVVEARDAYNNPVPVPNALNGSATGGSVRGPFADGPGRYRFVYEAPGNGASDTINVSYLVDPSSPSFDPERPENVQYTVDVHSDDGYVEGDGPLSAVEGSGLGKANHGSGSGVQFVLSNEGSSAVELTGVSVDSTTRASVRQLHETNGGTGDGQYEVYFDVNDDGRNDPEANDGWYETGDADGDEYVLGSGLRSLTSRATLGAGEDATAYVYEFRNNGGNGRDVGGHDVTVTVEYEAGGTTYAETFTVTAVDPYWAEARISAVVSPQNDTERSVPSSER